MVKMKKTICYVPIQSVKHLISSFAKSSKDVETLSPAFMFTSFNEEITLLLVFLIACVEHLLSPFASIFLQKCPDITGVGALVLHRIE